MTFAIPFMILYLVSAAYVLWTVKKNGGEEEWMFIAFFAFVPLVNTVAAVMFALDD